jgi:predicted PurR-regulated permease PerM
MQRDVTRTLLAVLSIGGLIVASFWILRPFLTAMIWATTLVVATWPVMLRLQKALHGKRVLAIAVMTTLMLVVLVLPFWIAISTVAENIDKVGPWVASLQDLTIPPPPAFVEHVPLVGDRIAAAWREAAKDGWGELADRFRPYIVQIGAWLASEVGTVGTLIVQFLLTVAVAAVLYAKGETVAAGVLRFGRRLAGERGEQSVRLAAQAVRGVALGVVVTALVQTLLAGLGLLVADIPFAGGLTIAILLLCVAQLGPILVLVPAVAWLYLSGEHTVGTLLLVWTVFVGALDNFLRPILIKKGADLPLLLIFAGVIGGLVSFGLLGIFVGPVVLAVTYKLLEAWVNEADNAAVAPATATDSEHGA